jgi:hypothetical protein
VGYVVTPYVGTAAQSPRVYNSTATTQVVTGLKNGTTYTFTVAAKNARGIGAQSEASNATTPVMRFPRVHLVGACTSAEPYAADLHIENFPVEEMRINFTITYADNSTFTNGWWFMPNGLGDATFPDVVPNATQPYTFDFHVFKDVNHDGVYQSTSGTHDEDRGSGFQSMSEPCSV